MRSACVRFNWVLGFCITFNFQCSDQDCAMIVTCVTAASLLLVVSCCVLLRISSCGIVSTEWTLITTCSRQNNGLSNWGITRKGNCNSQVVFVGHPGNFLFSTMSSLSILGTKFRYCFFFSAGHTIPMSSQV